MKAQRIKVNTKGGLLAAFECAKDYCGPTNIELKRFSGETIFNIKPGEYNSKDKVFPYYRCWSQKVWNSFINKAKSKIRKIPAKELLN